MTLQYLILYLFFQNVNCGNLEIELVKELFENYNKNLRPVHKASNFIDRDMRIVLASILKLDHLPACRCPTRWTWRWASQSMNWRTWAWRRGPSREYSGSIWVIKWRCGAWRNNNFVFKVWTDHLLSWDDRKKYAEVELIGDRVGCFNWLS